jgi:hypothetical protein
MENLAGLSVGGSRQLGARVIKFADVHFKDLFVEELQALLPYVVVWLCF